MLTKIVDQKLEIPLVAQKQLMIKDRDSQELEFIEALQSIQIFIQRNQFSNNAQKIKTYLTYIFARQFQSSSIVLKASSLHQAMSKNLLSSTSGKGTKYCHNPLEMAEKYLYLALTSQIAKSKNAQNQYRLALNFQQKNPLVNLNLALLLYLKQQYKKATKHINNISVQTAFNQRHRMNIWYVLLIKAGVNTYSCLYQRNIKGASEQQIVSKNQFIVSLIKLKQLFLYRCIQVEQLSEKSYKQLGILLYWSCRFEDSLVLTQKLRNINDPPTESIQQYLTQSFYLSHKFEDSVECAKQVLRINPRNQYIYFWLISASFQLDKLQFAKKCTLSLMSLNKYNIQAYSIMGNILLRSRQLFGLQYLKLGATIQPSQSTYLYLGDGFFSNGLYKSAYYCYFKSICMKPNQINYSRLGLCYLGVKEYLNAIQCFILAISYDILDPRIYFYLGVCAKRNTIVKSIINVFMESFQQSQLQNVFLQTNFSIYKFISDQQRQQIYSFLIKFKQEVEETVYLDIATKIFGNFTLILQIYQTQNIAFAIIMGILGRAKQQYIQTHKIYRYVLDKYRLTKDKSLLSVFTEIYQRQIHKTPKDIQAMMLQFIIAEMVQQNHKQALICFQKSRLYAMGDYKQFYVQLYKKIERDIEELETIQFITIFITNKQYLTGYEQEDMNINPSQKLIQRVNEYIISLEKMVEIRTIINQQINNCVSKLQLHILLTKIKNFSQCFRITQQQSIYCKIFQQIQNMQNAFLRNCCNLYQIYKQKEDTRNLLNQLFLLIDQYFDCFVLNLKVKLIYNHFSLYIITKNCHKQFTIILDKIKDCPYYRFLQLRKNLQNLFKNGNKHTNKIFQVNNIHRGNDQVISKNSSIISLFNSDKDFQIYTESEDQRNQISLQLSIKDIQNGGQSFISEKHERLLEAKITKINNITKDTSTNNESISQQSNTSILQIPSFEEIYDRSSPQQNQWYQIIYSPNHTKFLNYRLYSKFNILLYTNTCCLIKYLSKVRQAKHIAQHVCDSSQFSSYLFSAKVEHGDYISLDQCLRGGQQERTLKWIQQLGPRNILRWIADIALGVSELQNLGIFHAQLFFRNTIRITKVNNFSFKIIDFDKAFKVQQTGKKDPSFECTKKLLDFWLKFRFEGQHSSAPIYNLNSSISSQGQYTTYYDPKDIIAYIYMGAQQSLIQELLAIKNQSVFSSRRIYKCIKLLKQHMRVSHLKQYCALVNQLLGQQQYGQNSQEFLDPQVAKQIFQHLLRLKVGKIDYLQFASQIKRSAGIVYSQIEENEY